LLINSNWWLALHDDPILEPAPSGRLVYDGKEITDAQVKRAASIIWHTLDFKLKVDA
jgi:hypothetical protein